MQEDEPEIQEVVEVVTTAKLITKAVAAVSETVSAAGVVQADEPAAPVNVAAVVTTAAPVNVVSLLPDKEEELLLGIQRRNHLQRLLLKPSQRTREKAKFNANIEFLLKSKEQMEEEENIAIALINETPAQKAAKRRRLNKEAEDVEELKQHLEIVPDEDDDVYT
nr:hypothetical protein [Tanacetum cinerariifolium]